MIELTKVIYLAWDLGSRLYITLYFCAKAVEETITYASILPFSCLSPQFYTQSELCLHTHVNVQYAITVSTSAVKDSPQPT